MPFRWTINPYRGCTHACVFCFARPTHKYLDFNAGRDFESEIVVKVNVPEVLRAELRRPSWKREHIAMGTNTDPYQWVEGRYKLMPGDLGGAARLPQPVLGADQVAAAAARPATLLKEIASVADVSANLVDPDAGREGLAGDRAAHAEPAGADRGGRGAQPQRASRPAILIAPLMPGINDDPKQVEEILELAARPARRASAASALHLRGEVRGVFLDWLRLLPAGPGAALRAALRATARTCPRPSASGSPRCCGAGHGRGASGRSAAIPPMRGRSSAADGCRRIPRGPRAPGPRRPRRCRRRCSEPECPDSRNCGAFCSTCAGDHTGERKDAQGGRRP